MRTILTIGFVLVSGYASAQGDIAKAKAAFDASAQRLATITKQINDAPAGATNGRELFEAKRREWKICTDAVLAYNALADKMPKNQLAKSGLPDFQSTRICK